MNTPSTIKDVAMRYPIIKAKEGRERVLLRGHPWLFSGAIERPIPDLEPGEVVCAVDFNERPIALGFYHPDTDIAFRLLTANVKKTIDRSFFIDRIRKALHLRGNVLKCEETTAFRLINAEGDGLPGLVVDRYGEYLVMSISTAGMDRFRDHIVEVLVHELNPKSIYERSKGRSRQREGLSPRREVAIGEEIPPLVQIRENGIPFWVDLLAGQKTGFYLDQRPNRMALGPLARDKVVLNGFSYTASFAVYALLNGAKRVVSVDNSSKALDVARRNLDSNGLTNYELIQGDMFRYLRETSETFDLIILDPPAFAKSLREKEGALRGYLDINKHALQRLKPNGMLATFSCSNALDVGDFDKVVSRAAAESAVRLQVIRRLGAGPDHPVLLSHAQGGYLKGVLLSVFKD